MVGGIVVDTKVLDDKVWVNCHDAYYANLGKIPTERNCCAVYIEKNDKSKCISEGDIIWWQAGKIMWTPKACKQINKEGLGKDGKTFDIILKKIGYSGVNKPNG